MAGTGRDPAAGEQADAVAHVRQRREVLGSDARYLPVVSARPPESVLSLTPACTPMRTPISLAGRSLPALPSVYAAEFSMFPNRSAVPQRLAGDQVRERSAPLHRRGGEHCGTGRCVGPVPRKPGVTCGDAASLAAGSQRLVIDARGCGSSNCRSSRYAALVQPKPTTFWV